MLAGMVVGYRVLCEVTAMYPLLGKCPHCGDDLVVTGLHCRNCDASMQGQFALGTFHRLTPEQRGFVEVFIRCEGKITRVEEELGISYPTVRSRLNEVIRAMGYEVPDEQEVTQKERREVLAQLSKGQVTLEEAVALLQRS